MHLHLYILAVSQMKLYCKAFFSFFAYNKEYNRHMPSFCSLICAIHGAASEQDSLTHSITFDIILGRNIVIFKRWHYAEAYKTDKNIFEAGEEYLLEEVAAYADEMLTRKGEIFSDDMLYRIGYIYRYWHYYNGEDSAKIYKQTTALTMKRNYMIFHTMDPVLAIEDLKEIHNQKR